MHPSEKIRLPRYNKRNLEQEITDILNRMSYGPSDDKITLLPPEQSHLKARTFKISDLGIFHHQRLRLTHENRSEQIKDAYWPLDARIIPHFVNTLEIPHFLEQWNGRVFFDGSYFVKKGGTKKYVIAMESFSQKVMKFSLVPIAETQQIEDMSLVIDWTRLRK